MLTRIACIAASLGVLIAIAGCKSTEQKAWVASGPSNSPMYGMMSAPVAADADATGAIQLGAGDALGFRLYMNHVAFVHGNTNNGSMYATGSDNDAPRD